MSKNYGVIRTDRMFGTDNRAGLVSVLIPTEYDDAALEHLENGCVVKLNGLVEGERELYNISMPDSENLVDLAIIASPEMLYDERMRNLDDFTNVAGKPARAYRLHHGDTFSLTLPCFGNVPGTAPAIGDRVAVSGTGWKLVYGGDNVGAGNGTIIDINVVGRYTYFAIQIDD